ncbi:MAG: hypothetical protein WCJ56_04020 [bacterium]
MDAENRKVVIDEVKKLYGDNWKGFVDATFRVIIDPQAPTTIKKDELVNFLIDEGSQDLTLDYVKRLFNNNNRDGAMLLIKAISSATATTDTDARNSLVDYLISINEHEAAIELIKKSMAEVPEPYRRDIRVMYTAAVLAIAKKVKVEFHPIIIELENDKNLLLAAEAYLSDGKPTKAAEILTPIFKDKTPQLELRLAAWRTLLDCDPEAALGLGSALVNEIADAKENQHAWYRWMGKQLDRVVTRDLEYRRKGLNSSPFMVPPIMNTTLAYDRLLPRMHIQEVKEWTKQVLAILQQLEKNDPAAILVPERPTGTAAVQITMALLFALNAEDDKSIELLTRDVKYEYAAPKEGWPMGSVVRGDEYKPQIFTVPDMRSSSRSFTELLLRLLSCDAAAIERDGKDVPVSPLYAKVIINSANSLSKQKNDEIKNQMKELGNQLDTTVTRIGLNKYDEGKDVEVIQDALKAVEDSLKDNAVACNATALITPIGLDAALIHAKTTKMAEALFGLIDIILDKYQVATNNASTTASIANLIIRHNAGRKDLDLKGLTEQLQMKYVK